MSLRNLSDNDRERLRKLGVFLAKLRNAADIKQTALTAKIGEHVSFVCRIETGGSASLTAPVLVKWLDALKADVPARRKAWAMLLGIGDARLDKVIGLDGDADAKPTKTDKTAKPAKAKPAPAAPPVKSKAPQKPAKATPKAAAPAKPAKAAAPPVAPAKATPPPKTAKASPPVKVADPAPKAKAKSKATLKDVAAAVKAREAKAKATVSAPLPDITPPDAPPAPPVEV